MKWAFLLSLLALISPAAHSKDPVTSVVKTFLNTWEPNPFNIEGPEIRLDFAIRSLCLDNSFFCIANKQDLQRVLLRKAKYLFKVNNRAIAQDLASCVAENIFTPEAMLNEGGLPLLSYSQAHLMRKQEMIADEIIDAVESFRLTTLDSADVQSRLIDHLCAISPLRFGFSTLRRQIESFRHTHEDELRLKSTRQLIRL